MPVFNDSDFPLPGEKVTQIANRKANQATKWKPTWTPPRTRRVQSAAPSALVAAPLKTQSAKPAYEPYNPYPPRKKPPPKIRTQTSFGSWSLFALTGILLLAGALLVSTFFIQKAIERQFSRSIAKALLPIKPVATVTYANAKVSLFRQSVRFNDLKIEISENEKHPSQTITIAHASVWGIDLKSLIQIAMTRKPVLPETVRVSLDAVHLDSDVLGAQGQQALQSMGYKDLMFSLYASLNFGKNRKSFDLEHLQIDAVKMGRFDVSLSLGNLTLPTTVEIARLKADPKLILTETGEFTKATIKGFEIGFRDASFVPRAMEALVRMGETSLVTLTEMAIQVNSNSRGLASANADFVKPALGTLLSFLKSPSSITLSARPLKPVPVLSLFDNKTGGSINELAHRLNMSVE